MKFITINLLLAICSLATSTAQANDAPVKQMKTAAEINIDDIKCGPLADFYELVAQRPRVNKSNNVLAKEASQAKNTANTTLAANDSSQDAKKTD